MRHLHLFSRDENDKFSDSYIKFIEENFDSKDHLFVIASKFNEIVLKQNVHRLSTEIRSILFLIKKMQSAEKIYLHGLDFYMVLLCFIQPWLLKKSNWIIWGGDLYYYKYRDTSFVSNIKEILRKVVIKNIGGLITHLYGDYKLAQKWYGAKGKYYYCFLYPSNLYKDINLYKVNKEEDKLYIQVGNSACPTNEHIEVFEKLAKIKDRNIEIICPLSYSGKQDYIDTVKLRGFAIFGEELFSPIEDFMPFEDYLNLLGKVDVAIFNHKRQRGLGNITTLLGLGKKVYIREEITTWDFCKEHGLEVYSANNGLDSIFEPISNQNKKMNHNIMMNQFSKEKLVRDWEAIFSV